MTLEDGIFTWANSETEIQAILGEANLLRLYKLKVPQGSRMPATVMQRSGSDRQQRRCGPDGSVGVSIQLDHYGKTWAEARALAELFRITLQGKSFPAMLGSVRVKAATLENDFDLDDPEPGRLRTTQFWTFWQAE